MSTSKKIRLWRKSSCSLSAQMIIILPSSKKWACIYSYDFLFPFARCSQNMSTARYKSNSNALSSSRPSSRSAKWSSSAVAASILASSSESSKSSELSSSSDKPVCFRLVETRNPGRRTSCGCIQNGEVLDLVTLRKKLTRSTIGSQQANLAK